MIVTISIATVFIVNQSLTSFPLRASIDLDNEVKAGPDWRKDWGERKMCNLLTYMQEDCGKVLDNQCYNEKEIMMWNDMTIEVLIGYIESFFGKWDSAKCPAAK